MRSALRTQAFRGRTPIRLALAVSLACGALAGCVTRQPTAPPAADAGAYAEWARVADAVLASDAPDAAWVAALYLMQSARAQRATDAAAAAARAQRALALFARAAAEQPNDPIPALVALAACTDVPGCDADAIAAATRVRFPDAALALLPPLRAAVESQDEGRIDGVLTEVAGSASWDLHWNETITRATSVIQSNVSHLSSADAWRYRDARRVHDSVVGMVGAALPALQWVARPCRASAAGGARRDDCLAIARAAQSADTALLQSFGYSLALQLLPEGSAERAESAARRRALHWRIEQAAKLQSAAQMDASREYAARLPREEDSMSALLQANGVALEPPAAWKEP